MSIAFTVVENDKIYYDGVKEWRQKDTADKTREDFKTFFAREFRDISVRSIRNGNHERRTHQRRGEGQHATATGRSAREFGHGDGSRQTSSDIVVH